MFGKLGKKGTGYFLPCRIKPQVDGEDCRPAPGEDGSARYLAIRHHGNGAIRKTARRIGTMQELSSPEFWRTT